MHFIDKNIINFRMQLFLIQPMRNFFQIAENFLEDNSILIFCADHGELVAEDVAGAQRPEPDDAGADPEDKTTA